MSETFESIKEGLKEAVEFSQGKLPDAKVMKIEEENGGQANFEKLRPYEVNTLSKKSRTDKK